MTKTPEGFPVIGGPRRPDSLPDGCVFPPGYYIGLPGTPINRWPWRINNPIVGMLYIHRGTFHIYRLMKDQWRYAGKAKSREDARERLIYMHEHAGRVQPVAPKPVEEKISPPRRTRGNPNT